jgi:hypothetical protein
MDENPIPEGRKDACDETVPEGRMKQNSNNNTYNKNDIRSFGKSGEKTVTTREMFEEEFVDTEEMDRKGRMVMMRKKMCLPRKKYDRRPVETVLQLKEHKMRAKTSRGLRLLHASKVPNAKVQDDDKKVIVGSDVEGLYPALEDMEVANIGYQAILKTSVKFNNKNFRKADIYVAMNITEEEKVIHPLARELPVRKGKKGSTPWITGSMKNAEGSWRIPEREWTMLEERILVAEVVRIGVIVQRVVLHASPCFTGMTS